MKNPTYLEHINFTVQNLNETVKFLQIAIPTYHVRGSGAFNGRKWLHIGTDETYLALNEYPKSPSVKDYNATGFNHFGFVVPDVEEVAERLINAGYKRSYDKQIQQFRIRDYFYDGEGNEFEFVQYLSEEPSERNDYSN